uniref:Cytochrome P450 n=1 Tax=Aplanochytrium stocchinoi TaxID=215587 RepID=A0A7S3LJX7_9STRA
MPDQGLFLHTGVLSQLDNDRWREQRAHLSEAFLPFESLKVLFDVSDARAVKSLAILRDQAASNSGIVRMNEFLLNETMAQLCLAMFGLPEDMVEKYNKRIRNAFAVALEATGGAVGGAKPDMDQTGLMKAAGFLFSFINKFLNETQDRTGVSELDSGAKINGPLSARIQDISDDMEGKYFNAATFIFAGHDTTANTMSWLLYEVCLNPKIQDQLRAEADAMFESLGPGEKLNYGHLQKLPFMTRCITETLRKWPVVPNGTFRQLQFDEVVKGPNNTRVRVPKGTFVQITNWMRHRSPKLWKDPETFNPDREFLPEELWFGKPLAAFNPSTSRFSPFTFSPRDCMGKNFAQMEMRVILAHLFHNFYFELASPTKDADPKTFMGVNRATLGPRDTGIDPSEPAALGLYLTAIPR